VKPATCAAPPAIARPKAGPGRKSRASRPLAVFVARAQGRTAPRLRPAEVRRWKVRKSCPAHERVGTTTSSPRRCASVQHAQTWRARIRRATNHYENPASSARRERGMLDPLECSVKSRKLRPRDFPKRGSRNPIPVAFRKKSVCFA
jgi:hypothetical protein